MWCLCFQNLQDFLWKLGFFGIVSLKDKVMLFKVNFFFRPAWLWPCVCTGPVTPLLYSVQTPLPGHSQLLLSAWRYLSPGSYMESCTVVKIVLKSPCFHTGCRDGFLACWVSDMVCNHLNMNNENSKQSLRFTSVSILPCWWVFPVPSFPT